MKICAAFFFATSVAMANRVVKVEVMTSNCEDCGMGPFGSLEVEVYIHSVQDQLFTINLILILDISKTYNIISTLDLWRWSN